MSKEITNSNIGTSIGNLAAFEAQSKMLSKGLEGIKLPPIFHQLVLFVLDGSGSMTFDGLTGESKGEEVNNSVKGVIERLLNSKHSNCFDINIWSYSSEVNEMHETTSVDEVNPAYDFNPCNYVENELTYLQTTLLKTESIASNYLDLHNEKNAQVLILLLSDGAIHDQEESLLIAERIKTNNNITIASYLLEDKNWKENEAEVDLEMLRNNLRDLSSSTINEPNLFFKSTVDPDEVRKHMIQSLTKVTTQII